MTFLNDKLVKYTDIALMLAATGQETDDVSLVTRLCNCCAYYPVLEIAYPSLAARKPWFQSQLCQ